MADYSALKVIVTADTRGLSVNIRQAATSAGDDAAKTIGQTIGAGLKSLAPVGTAALKGIATGIGVVTTAATGFGLSAFASAARVGEMNASLRALAKANNLSYPAMQQTVSAIRKQGIEANVAQTLVAQFARNQLNLADATKLATVAQDAAVISGRNSTEVLADLVHGVTTQNSLVLRNAGINVQAGQAMDSYAKSLGKTTAQLSDAERSQAVLNAVLESGKSVAGAYAEAMTEPGKVLRSFPRIIDDIKVSVGAGLVKALGPAILGAYDLAKAFSKAVEPGGVLAPVFDAIGVAVGRMVGPLNAGIAAATRFFDTLDAGKVAGIVSVIERFGPAIAVAAVGITALSGAPILGSIPLIGPIISNLIGPLTLLGKQLGSVAAAALKVIPGFAGVKVAGGSLGAALGGAAAPVAAIVGAIVLVAAASAKFRTALLDVAKAIGAALMPVLRQLIPAFAPVAVVVWELAKAIGDALGPAISALAPAIVPVGSILASLLVVLGGVLKVVAAVLVPIIRLAGAIAALVVVNVTVPYFQRFAAILSTVANAIATVVRWIFGGSPGLIPALQALAAVASATMGVVVGVIVGGMNRIAGAIRAAWSVVTSTTSAAWSVVRSVISAGVKAAQSAVSSGASAMVAAVRSMASAFASSGAAAGNALRSSITGGINAARSAVQSAVSAMIGAARSLVGGFASAGAAAASAMAGAISGGLSGLVGMVQSKLAGIVSAAKSALSIGSPSRVFWDIGLDVVAGFLGGILAAPLLGPVAALFGAVGPAAAGALGGFGIAAAGGPAGGPAHAAQLAAAGPVADFSGLLGGGDGGGPLVTQAITVNVYPQPGQSEAEIAAAVSRRLAWAAATGRAD